jgi:polysaccharide pyruvyl transferase WcaK-like protein
MRRATVICSRDELGVKDTQRQLGPSQAHKIKFCHDVGFVVQPIDPSTDELADLQRIRNQGQLIVGFNISGLLYAGGYTQDNMFGLKVRYLDIVERVLTFLVEDISAKVLLVPHVYGEPNVESIESDQAACEAVYKSLPARLKQSVVLLRGSYSAAEVKYVIGTCDAFIGSRMHSCIAAISQADPAVAISYSDKFDGVMRTLRMSDLIADPRKMSLPEIMAVISRTLDRQQELRQELKTAIPGVQANVVSTFKSVMLQCMQNEGDTIDRQPEICRVN